MTLRLMMMHHNIKFGNKLFGGLEVIIWTNIDILTLHCVLDAAIQLFSQDSLAYDDVSKDLSLVAEESTVQKIQSKVIF